jgi:hypothetical protein
MLLLTATYSYYKLTNGGYEGTSGSQAKMMGCRSCNLRRRQGEQTNKRNTNLTISQSGVAAIDTTGPALAHWPADPAGIMITKQHPAPPVARRDMTACTNVYAWFGTLRSYLTD